MENKKTIHELFVLLHAIRAANAAIAPAAKHEPVPADAGTGKPAR